MSAQLPKSIWRELRAGQRVQVMCLAAMASPKWIEIAGLYEQLSGVWIDQEHAAISHERLEILMMACRAAGLDGFARVAPTDYATLMRPYEAGCSGVMVAQIRSLEQVRQVIEWTHYPPIGQRGLFMGNYEAGYGTRKPAEHIAQATQQRWLAIQIETPEAVEIVDEIAASPEVDVVFVGPADLACTLGVPGQLLHRLCTAALARVAAACKKHHKPWGTLSRTPEHAAHCRELGCQLFSVYGDLDVIHHGFQALQKTYQPLLD